MPVRLIMPKTKRRGYRIEWWRTTVMWTGKRVLRLKTITTWQYYTHIVCIDNGKILWSSQGYTRKRNALDPAVKFAEYLAGGKRKIEIVELV